MKFFLTSLIILTTFLACKDNTTTNNAITEDNKKPSVEGTWKLIMRYNYDNNKIVDSFTSDNSFQQVKIYTKEKVMWTRHLTADSTDWFGYGSYKYDGNILTEVLDYGSKTMQPAINNNTQFKIEIEITDDDLNSVFIDDDGNRLFSEKYKRIE
tara:strand:+ start:1270 stop:1731 length:462 start_codon:yes stop_codon:yes gene_type:complete